MSPRALRREAAAAGEGLAGHRGGPRRDPRREETWRMRADARGNSTASAQHLARKLQNAFEIGST